MQALMDAIEAEKQTSQLDLATYNYAALRPKPESFWVVQLAHMGFVDRNGRHSDNPFPGSQPAFQIYICEYHMVVYDGEVTDELLLQTMRDRRTVLSMGLRKAGYLLPISC